MAENKDGSPLVSVIVPTWNRSNIIARVLDSILVQSFSNLEIIVGDNASDDDTYEIIMAYANSDSRVKCFRNCRNLGAIHNWRECLSRAKGDYIKVVWSDDWLEPNTIQELLLPLLGDESLGFTFCSALIHPETNNTGNCVPIKAYRNKKNQKIGMRELASGFAWRYPHLPYSPSAAMIRRKYADLALSNHFVLTNECIQKAIGSDLLMIYSPLIDGKLGLYVDSTSVHFTHGYNSITLASSQLLLNRCYDIAVSAILRVDQKWESRYRLMRVMRALFDLRPSRSCLDRKRLKAYLRDFKLQELPYSYFRSLACILLRVLQARQEAFR